MDLGRATAGKGRASLRARSAAWLVSALPLMTLSGCFIQPPDGSVVAQCSTSSGGHGHATTFCVADPGVDPTPTGSTSQNGGMDLATAPGAQPRPTRSQVVGTIADAGPDIADEIAPHGMPVFDTGPGGKSKGKGDDDADLHRTVAHLTLQDAVATAVLSHPTMGAAAAKVRAALADVSAAKSAFNPTLSVTTGTGWSTLGQYSNYPFVGAAPDLPGTSRTDVGVSFRQLIYDFGAAREMVEKNKSAEESETLKLADQAEDIALRTVNAYLNLIEQQELLSLIDQTIASQRKLAGLVKLSQQNGASAASDVDRINSKIIEIEASRADIDSAYHIALAEFKRLTNIEPKQVRDPHIPDAAVPANADLAVRESRKENPAVLAIRAQGVSLEHELQAQKAQGLPHIDFEGDSAVKHYIGTSTASVGIVDNRAMVVLSYKMFDGGLNQAEISHIRASQEANDYNELDQMETLELNIRRFYETLNADRLKQKSTELGVATAEKVNQSYLEQFKAGKRTVFEVLDSYTSIFTMRKNKIEGQYEAMRSQYGILRNLGRLNKTLALESAH